MHGSVRVCAARGYRLIYKIVANALFCIYNKQCVDHEDFYPFSLPISHTAARPHIHT